jgi:hypothetical protein
LLKIPSSEPKKGKGEKLHLDFQVKNDLGWNWKNEEKELGRRRRRRRMR